MKIKQLTLEADKSHDIYGNTEVNQVRIKMFKIEDEAGYHLDIHSSGPVCGTLPSSISATPNGVSVSGSGYMSMGVAGLLHLLMWAISDMEEKIAGNGINDEEFNSFIEKLKCIIIFAFRQEGVELEVKNERQR